MSFWDMPSQKQAFSSSTELATVPYERTILGSAYDITRTNLNYAPDLQSVIIESIRDVITQGNYGKIMASQKSSLMTVDVGEYARATGTDLMPKNPASAGFTDVYKIETIRDVYPSGMAYENIIGRKGTIETQGLPSMVQISSRGIAYGQGTIERNAMAQADGILNDAIPRVKAQSRISPTDLPTTIKDLSSGYGNINIEGMGSINLAVINTRVVRATTPLEQIFGEHAIQNPDAAYTYPISVDKYAGIKSILVEEPKEAGGMGFGVNLPGSAKGNQLSSLFETLPNHGVIGTEVISSYEGTPLVPVVSGGNIFDVNAGVKDMLFGGSSNAFQSEATRLREGAGTERVRRPYDVHKPPITSLSKTFGKQKPAAPANIGSGKLKQIAAVSQEFTKAETNRIGSNIEEILGKARAQTVSQPQKSETISGGSLNMLAPSRLEDIAFPSGPSPISRGRTVLFEEEGEQFPSAEALRRTGISERAGFKEPQRGQTREESIIDLVTKSGLRTGLVPGNIQSTHLDQTQRSGRKTEFQSITDIIPGSMVIDQTILGRVQKTDTTQKITPTSRTDISVIPYQTTVPEELVNTKVSTQVIQTPWEKVTPYEQSTKTVTPVPPVPVIPIVPIPIPGLPWGGGGGGSGGSPIGRGRLKRELFTYQPVNVRGLLGMPKMKQPRRKK
jgi:hypothetical protein